VTRHDCFGRSDEEPHVFERDRRCMGSSSPGYSVCFGMRLDDGDESSAHLASVGRVG